MAPDGSGVGEGAERSRPRPPGSVLAGIDGCRSGWVVALAGTPGTPGLSRRGPAGVAPLEVEVEVRVVPDVAAAVALAGERAVVAIDIPIGLPARGPRACDVAARRLLGRRRSSVFPAPVRAALDVHEQGWDVTLATSRRVAGVGLSRQAFHLLPKIAEVDRLLAAAPEARVVEGHPELAFARLAGTPLSHPKRTVAGRSERVEALRGAIADVGGHLERRPAGCAVDDLLDALALVVTAGRLSLGTADLLGDGGRDDRGRPMTIAW